MDSFNLPSRLSVTSDTANIACVRAATEEAARKVGFCEADVCAIALAVGEAIANVIRHGYKDCPGQPIEVTLESVSRENRPGLQVTICDCGRQVDPVQIVGRDLDDVRPGGLGTHIMRKVMDEVEYSHRQPIGMQLRLVKTVAASAGQCRC
jgi:anti-sigma regulatory factor (Ser/Thr protein kinase)